MQIRVRYYRSIHICAFPHTREQSQNLQHLCKYDKIFFEKNRKRKKIEEGKKKTIPLVIQVWNYILSYFLSLPAFYRIIFKRSQITALEIVFTNVMLFIHWRTKVKIYIYIFINKKNIYIQTYIRSNKNLLKKRGSTFSPTRVIKIVSAIRSIRDIIWLPSKLIYIKSFDMKPFTFPRRERILRG